MHDTMPAHVKMVRAVFAGITACMPAKDTRLKMKRSKKFGLLLLAAWSSAVLPNVAWAAITCNVQLTTPTTSEWGQDLYGGIWNANVANSADPSQTLSNGLIMCTGDLDDIYIGQLTGSYTAVDFLSASPSQIAGDPGHYAFPPGFSLASRTPNVQAQTAFLIDQLDNVLVQPTNLQGLTTDQWIGCKGDALTGAIHKIWDGVDFTPSSAPLEEPIETIEYNAYLAAAAGINAANYTSSQALWLTNSNGSQVLFSKWSATYPPEIIGDSLFAPSVGPAAGSAAVPEPSTLTVWLSLGGLGVVFGYVRRRQSA